MKLRYKGPKDVWFRRGCIYGNKIEYSNVIARLFNGYILKVIVTTHGQTFTFKFKTLERFSNVWDIV